MTTLWIEATNETIKKKVKKKLVNEFTKHQLFNLKKLCHYLRREIQKLTYIHHIAEDRATLDFAEELILCQCLVECIKMFYSSIKTIVKQKQRFKSKPSESDCHASCQLLFTNLLWKHKHENVDSMLLKHTLPCILYFENQ